MSDFVLPISGEMSVGAALNGEVSIGSVIFNDYIITISDINGGHRLTARRGSDIQTMDILNGVDAPVPDIKITDVVHGHDVTITVGDVAKTFYIHDGVDAPVPEIDVETVQGGHKVIATVGDTVKSFIVKDGVDGRDGVDGKNGVDGKTPVKGVDYFDGQPGQPGKDGISPVINVSDIENGHRVTITTGSNVQSFDVVDGKDGKSAVSPTVSVTEIEGGHRVTINSEGKTDSFDVMNGRDGEDAEGGTVEVDPTLSIEGMAADAKATGDAVKPIAAITETTTTNAITWDGVIGDRLTVAPAEGMFFVRVSDYVPDMSVFIEQGFAAEMKVDGTVMEQAFTVEEAQVMVVEVDANFYTLGEIGAFVTRVDNYEMRDQESSIVIPKAGVYFIKVMDAMHTVSISSPLLAVPTVKVKPEALPDNIGGDSNIVVVSVDMETMKLEKTPAEIMALIMSGKMVLCAVTAAPFSPVMDDTGENIVGVSSGQISMQDMYGNGNPVILYAVTLFDGAGTFVGQDTFVLSATKV